jgi:CheY-like chemotaxis protein/anti-sigma regulatory factor (Ser/Thr protein kinase)
LNLRLHVEQQVRSVSGDERLLKQALVHLLENAVKYTPTGGNVTLEATGDPDHKQMHFTVSDTGMGIPSDLRSRLFEPIFHRETTATQSVSGTGIGLHLVSRIAEAHGGRVDVDSELGSGSRFVITLPWAGPRFGREAPAEEYTRPTPTEDRELLRPAQVRGNRVQALEQQLSDLQSAVDRTLASLPEGEPLQLARQQPRPKLRLHRNEEALRVLVVDSQTPIVNALREYLPKRGYRLSFAPTLAAGLELAAADRPDALMVDPDMENGAGLDAIRQFREVLGPVTLIVAMKANLDEEFRDLCTLAGASDFVNKPLKLKHVVRTLDTQLRNGSGSAE